MKGGSEVQFTTSLPADPVDPVDCSGSGGVFQTSVSCTRNATVCIGDTEIATLCIQKI